MKESSESIINPPEFSLEQKKEHLRTEFIRQLKENIRDKNLTLQQLQRLSALAADSRDEDPVDFFAGNIMDDEKDESMGKSRSGLRGIKTGDHISRESLFSTLVGNTFSEVHEPTLKSKLPRHNDGLTYKDIGLSVPDFKLVLNELVEEVAVIQEKDVEQTYDKKALASFVEDMDFHPINGLSEFFDSHAHEKFAEVMSKKIKDLPRMFPDGAQGDRTSLGWGKSASEKIVRELGPDVAELPAEELYRLVKNRMDQWNKEKEEKAEMRQFDPEI